MNQDEAPQNLKYAKTHEWVRVVDQLIEVGITDFAQSQLSDITYLELPEIDSHFQAGEEVAMVESIKAASDIYAPVTGEVIEVNEDLLNTPEYINSDPFNEGWLFRMKPDSMEDIDSLLSADEYKALLPEED